MLSRVFVALAIFYALAAPRPGLALEAGLTLTDPDVMQRLEGRGFGLREMLAPVAGPTARAAKANDAIFALRPMTPIRNAIKSELCNLNPEGKLCKSPPFIPSQRSSALEPYEPLVMKVVSSSPELAFDFKYIDSPAGRLELTGIVNRMDRAFVVRNDVPGERRGQEATCGEIRLIYRFAYDIDPDGPARELSSRLPMTMNLVLDARPRGGIETPSCRTIARRWKALESSAQSGEALVEALVKPDGPLAGVSGNNIDRIELNMQILRLRVANKSDTGGHAEYLLKVFRWDPVKRIFQESKLENQIDRDRMIRREDAASRFTPGLLQRFKNWLIRPEVMASLDAGTLLIRDEFLAVRGVSVAPGGMARSQNDPFRGFFTDHEIEAAIRKLKATGPAPRTLLSPEAFRLRLAQTSCTGCHQSRAIAGFHFPGADRKGSGVDAFASNQVFVPASAHFYADLPRRRAVINAFATGKARDYFRYFPGRADQQYRADLAGTQLFDGWGATCYASPSDRAPDPAFSDWGCAPTLTCKVLHASAAHADLGVCVGKDRIQVGDPLEFGRVETAAHGADRYRRLQPPQPVPYDKSPPPSWCGSACVVSHQQLIGNAGGFPGGMLRLKDCFKLPVEATCGRVAADGFNACVDKRKKTFKECLIEHSAEAGLRACDVRNPCREDYICTARHADIPTAKAGMGTCIPPYFMFQFRADGHPYSWTPLSDEQ